MLILLTLIDAQSEKTEFERIYNEYSKQMLYLCESILHSVHDSEDAVMNAFVGIAKNIKTISSIENENDKRNYVLASARNCAYNILRQRKKEVVSFDSSELEKVSDELFVEEICKKAQYDEIVSMFKQLDSKYSEILYLYFTVDLSLKEIAAMLGKKYSTVRKQFERAKKLLIDRINEKEE